MVWSVFDGWSLEKQSLKFNWASGNVNLRIFSFFFFFFYTWINHFKVQEWRTRWNWKHRTIFHSFLQLSPLLFTSFKFNSLCEEIQSIEFVAQCTWNHSFLCAWETLYVIGRCVLGTYILYSAGHVWGTPETRRVILKFEPKVQTGD